MSIASSGSKLTGAGLLGFGLLLAACGQAAKGADQDIVSKGRYLVEVGACHDCHSPKVMTANGPIPDPSRLLSGHPSSEPVPADLPAGALRPDQWMAATNAGLTAWVGPWGTSFTANLTPDASGLAGWTPDGRAGASGASAPTG